MSQTVYDVVKNRLFLQAVRVGDLRLKNISEPVSAYKVSGLSAGRRHKHRAPLHWAAYTIAGLALVVLGSVATAALMGRQEQPKPIPESDGGMASAISQLLKSGQILENEGKIGKVVPHPETVLPVVGNNSATVADIERYKKEQAALTKDNRDLQELLRRHTSVPSSSGTSKVTPSPSKASQDAPASPTAPKEADPSVPTPPVAFEPGSFPTEWGKQFQNGMFKSGEGSFPIPPNLADLKGMESYEKAWRSYAKHFDFKGMRQWVERNKAKLPTQFAAKDIADLSRMEALSDFVKSQMSKYPESAPLNFKLQSGDCSAWTSPDDLIVLKLPTGQIKTFRDLTSAQFVNLARALIDRMDGTEEEKRHWRNEVVVYGTDARLLAIGNRRRATNLGRGSAQNGN